MKNLSKHLRIFSVAAAVALAAQPLASIATSTDAHATRVVHYTSSMMAPAASGSSAGGWIIGGLFFSVASIITCAMIVGAEEGRELTLDEAVHAGLIPLHCLFDDLLDTE